MAYKTYFIFSFFILLSLLSFAFANPLTITDANSQWNDRNTVTFSCSDNNIGYVCNDLKYSLNSGAWNVIDINAGFIKDNYIPMAFLESFVSITSMEFNSDNNLVYTGGSGFFGSYNADTNEWLDLSDTDTGNWISSSTIIGLAYNSIDKNIYAVLSQGKFGRYSPTTNVFTNLSTTDAGDWAGTSSSIYGVAFDSYYNLIYTGDGAGKLGVYDPSTNVWTDLSTKDADNWAGTNAIRGLVVGYDGSVYTGSNNGLLGTYHPMSDIWTNLSTKDAGDWAGTQQVYDLAYNPSTYEIYTSLSGGLFGVYSIVFDDWRNLSTTDTGNWAGTQQVISLNYNPDNNSVYTAHGYGLLGVYSVDSNVWTNLSTKDAGNWAGVTNNLSSVLDSNRGVLYTSAVNSYFGAYYLEADVATSHWDKSITGDTGQFASTKAFGSVAFDEFHDLVYYGSIFGQLVARSTVDGTWYDYSSTDASNWSGNLTVSSLVFDPNDFKLYTGLSGGGFGVFEFVVPMMTPTWTNLSSTDAGNWAGTSTVVDLAFVDGNIYTVLMGGKFGVYSPTTNVWTDLSATDGGNWVGTDSVTGIAYDSNNGYIYTGIANGKLGEYRPADNNWINLSTTDAGNWAINQPVAKVVCDSNKNLIYTLHGSGLFGVYSPDTGVWTNLSNTDVGNFMINGLGTSMTYDSVNDLVYVGQAVGIFGVYDYSKNTTYNLISTGQPSSWHMGRSIASLRYNSKDKKIYAGVAGGSATYSPIATYTITVPEGNTQIDYMSRSRYGVNSTGSYETQKTDYHAFGTGVVNVYGITFNVNTDALGINVDCNVNDYDVNDQTSPFVIEFNEGSYSCIFSKPTAFEYGYYDTNTIIVVADENKSYDVTLNWIDNYRFLFNVFASGTETHINGVNFDCNVNALDLTNQDSPFYSPYYNKFGSANCSFSATGYDTNNLDLYFYWENGTSIDANIYLTLGVNYEPHMNIIVPDANTYSGTLAIDANVYDPENNTIVCDFNLYDSSLTNIGIIATNVSPSNGHCTADLNTLAYADGNYYIFGVVRETGTTELYSSHTYSDEFIINNAEAPTTPTINSIIINGGNNLDGINYDLNTNISNATTATYKCYSGVGDGSSCTTNSWDCHLGDLTNTSGDNWSATIVATTRDTNGTWTCKITSGEATDSNTTIMNELTGIVVDTTSGTYNGNAGTNDISFHSGQSENHYIEITHNGNVDISITFTGEDFTVGENTIPYSNQSWYLTENASLSYPFTSGADVVKANWSKTETPQNIYLWFDIPMNTEVGEYTSTLTIGSDKS